MRALILLALATLAASTAGVYLHTPRGSNNRLFGDRSNPSRLFFSKTNIQGGYGVGPPMTYLAGSVLTIEFSTVRGCVSGTRQGSCEIIIQYMCGNHIRDGTIDDTAPPEVAQLSAAQQNQYGYHETVEYYDSCRTRQRNKGLYAAGMPLGEFAIETRQTNGTAVRSGFECPEEADYYPYWHSSPWKDIVVMTSEPSRCSYYQANSQNVVGKVGGGAHGIPAPECVITPEVLESLDLGKVLNYSWTIPQDMVNAGACVMRIRHNVSTSDLATWAHVDQPGTPMVNANTMIPGTQYNVTPTVNYGTPLQLPVLTHNMDRTFQDRSHVFFVSGRPESIPATAKIWNLSVRGRRGNNVQAYPATQYAFSPDVLKIQPNDYIHFQWTGSDTNAGGQAGQGRDRTDRSNILQIASYGRNFPIPLAEQTLFPSTEVAQYFADLLPAAERKPCAETCAYNCCRTREQMDSVERGQCVGQPDNGQNRDNQIQNCMRLNLQSPYFNYPPIQFSRQGVFYYMSTRNNAFSNRSHKGVIIVGSSTRINVSTFFTIFISIVSAVMLCAL